jgi:hypothetical protein
MGLPWDRKLVPRRSLPGALLVSAATPGFFPDHARAQSENSFHYPRTAAEAAAGVTPRDYAHPPGVVERYGADPTGAASSAAAINEALKCGLAIADFTYLLSGSDQIHIPANGRLTSRTGRGVFKITANAGSMSVAKAAFTVAADGELSGFALQYPQQTAKDEVEAIIRYPPTFTVGSFGRVRDLHVTGAYILCSQQAGFGEIFLEDIVAYSILYRGLDISGNADMRDTSRAHNVQIVLSGVAPQCGWNGPVQRWCRQNAIGVYARPTGNRRIDGFQLSNFNVVGGSLGYSIGPGAWFQGSSISADICMQSIDNSGQLYLDNVWCSVQDNNITAANIPAIRNRGGILQITGGRVGMLAANAQNAVFIDSGLVDMANVWFSTSRGAFTPCIYNQSGSVKLAGCTVGASGSTRGQVRPLSWQDCVVGDLVNGAARCSIDGKGTPSSITGPLSHSMPGFDMTSWSGGLPSGWSTNLRPGQYSLYFRDLFPIERVHGIEVYGGSQGSFSLSYELPPSVDDLFGYWLLTLGIKIIGATGLAASAFDITLGDRSGVDLYRLPFSWTGVNLEPTGIPTDAWYRFGGLLCSPSAGSPGHLHFNFNFLTAMNQRFRIQAPQLYAMQPPPECSGSEYFSFQSCQPRDVQSGPIKMMRRAAIPSAAGGWRDGDTAQRNPQAIGSPRGWVYVASSSSWVSLGNL